MCIFLHKQAGISHSSRFLNEAKCNGLWTKFSISELKTPISEGKNTQNRKYADMVPIQKQKKKAKSHEFKETELPEVEVPSPRSDFHPKWENEEENMGE